jgi:nickel transport protein
MPSLRRSVLLTLTLSLAAGPALGHSLRVFAFADGDRIAGSAYFAGGGAASGARIRVLDDKGGLLAELEPDAEGGFSYQALAPVDHVVVAETGDGHRAEWRVGAAELAPGFPVPQVVPLTAEASPAPCTAEAGPVPEQVAAIERAVARQMRPLREELAAARGRAGLRDVLGGIGYILGLAGLLAWWRCRRGGRLDGH